MARIVVPTPASASGLNLINSSAFTSVTSVSVNDVFSATYDNYLIQFISTTTLNVGARMRLRVGGSDDTTSNYGTRYVFNGWTVNSSMSATSFVFPEFGGDLTNAPENLMTYQVFSPFLTAKTFFRGSGFNSSAGNHTLNEFFHQFNATTSFTGFTIEQTSGAASISGKIKVYGLANS
jgi:hypothetical protein